MRTSPTRQASTDVRVVVMLIVNLRKMLVTFIALACVSCSFIPKKEINGTAQERPKLAQDVLTSLNAVNATLEVLYNSVSRGLSVSGQNTLDLFIVEAAAKKKEPQQQADLIKVSLEILIDLRSAKLEPALIEEAIQALRKSILLFDTPALRFIQELGRTNVSMSLQVAPQLQVSTNVMARTLFTLAVVVDRAALLPIDGKFPELAPDVLQKASVVQDALLKLQPTTFVALQPYIAQALSLSTPLDASNNIANQQSFFALDTLLNGVELATALQTQKSLGKEITREVLNNSFATWTTVTQQASTVVASGGSAPAPIPVPLKPPVLDSQTGALPTAFEQWTFVMVDQPQDGTLDLTKNPPRYTPNADFENADNYRFRACHPVIKSYCTDEKVMTVNRPLPPWTVTLKTTTGQLVYFKRGMELICEAAMRGSDQNPVYTWWLQRALYPNENRPGGVVYEDITALSTRPGRLILNDIKTDDKVICKVFGESPLGLRSVSPKDSNTLIAENSAPKSMTLTLPQGQQAFPLQESVFGDGDVPSPNQRRLIGRVLVTDGDPNSDPNSGPDDGLLLQGIPSCESPIPSQFCFDPQSKQTGQTTVPYENYSSWAIYLRESLNFETAAVVNLNLRAVDSKGNELQKSFPLNVIDRNDKIENILLDGESSAQKSVAENASLLVTQLGVTDEDCVLSAGCQNTGYTYSLVPGQDSSIFEIVGRSLRFKNLPDFETSPVQGYVVNVRVVDNNALVSDPGEMKSLVKEIIVRVTDVNEQPSDLMLSRSDIDENKPSLSTVGQFDILDVDDGQNQKPELFDFVLTEMTPGVSGYLEVFGNTLRTKAELDFELLKNRLPLDANNNKNYFEIMVTARDKNVSALSVTRVFKIYLNDVNETPTSISFSKTLLLERLPYGDSRSDIALTTTDPDLPAVNFTYQIKSVNNAQYNPSIHPLEISGNTLRPSRELKYTSDQGQPQDRQFVIEMSTNDGEFELTKTFVVQVASITISNASFPENDESATPATPKLVGQLCVNVGGQPECDAWAYQLKNNVVGIQLNSQSISRTRKFNHEVDSNVALNVRVEKLGTVFEKIIPLNVENRNDLPTGLVFAPAGNPLQTSPYTLLEELPAGTTVGTLSLLDEDFDDAVNWSLPNSVPDGVTYFEIVPRLNDRRSADLKVRSTLPTKTPAKKSLSVFVLANDFKPNEPSGMGSLLISFNLVSKARIEAVTAVPQFGFHHKRTDSGALSFDFRIIDETGSAPCSLSSGPGAVGVTLSSANDQLTGLLSEPPALTQLSVANGVRECRLSLNPKPNKTGEVALTLGVRWDTGVLLGGAQSSIETASSTIVRNVAFWRAPRFNCPSRMTLPPGQKVVSVPCEVSFSDQSGVGASMSVTLTPLEAQPGSCSFVHSSNTLSFEVFPSVTCTARLNWQAQNRYGEEFSGEQLLEFAPRKFSTNGLVKAVAKDAENNVYLGGSFTAVDPLPAAGITSLDVTTTRTVNSEQVVTFDGERSASCNLTEGFNGPVRAITDAGDGSFWVGGDFTHYRGTQVNYLTRLWCSGERVTWFSTGSAFDAPVHAIASASNGDVYIGGRFTSYNGALTRALVKLNADGVRDTGFQSGFSSGAIVNAIALSPSNAVWAGGRFTGYGLLSTVKNLVRIDSQGAIAAEFEGGEFNADVLALSVVDDGVIVGGSFTTYRGSTVNRILRVNMSGMINSEFRSNEAIVGFDGRVDVIAKHDSALFVGGAFRRYRGNLASGLAKISLFDGSQISWSGAAPSFEGGAVRALQVVNHQQGLKLIAGGQFSSVQSQARSRLAMIDADSGALNAEFNNGLGFNGSVLTLALFDGNKKVLVGGEFSTFEGLASSRLAKFSSSGVFDPSFTSGFGALNGDVETLAVADSALYVGGQFTALGATSVGRLAKLNQTSGSLVGSFSTNGGFNDVVRVVAVAPSGSEIYVGGRFTDYGGVAVGRIVRLNHQGQIDEEFVTGSGFTSLASGVPSVNAIAFTAGESQSVFIGGEFDQYAGESVRRLVKLNSSGTLDPEFDVSQGADAEILALAVKSNDLYVGGQFVGFAGNAAANRLVRLDAQTGTVRSGVAFNVNGAVRTLVVDQLERIVVGGSFTQVNSAASGPLFRVLEPNDESSQFSALGTFHLNSNLVSGVHALLPYSLVVDAQEVQTLIVGGLFSAYRNRFASGAVRVNTSAGHEGE